MEYANKSKRCKQCRYYRNPEGVATYAYCDYYTATGTRRGCEGGDKCTRYIRRKKKCEQEQ